MLGERAHIEPRFGTQDQAIAYCKKEDPNPYERGDRREQGHRTDLDNVRQVAMTEGMRGVSEQYSYHQMRTAEKFLTYNEEPRDWKPTVIWIWGTSGAGKSRLARQICEEYGNGDPYTKNDATKWWEGYDGHEDVIIDDFRDSWWPITETLRVLDRYECRVECKGGYRQLRARIIIVTSIIAPENMYRSATGEPTAQLLRRIDHIEKL